MALLEATVLHHVPGRMRIRLEATRKQPRQLETVRKALLPLPGVRAVSVNPLLGSMVVQYYPELFTTFPESMRAYAAERSLFSLEGSLKNSLQANVSVTDQSLDRFFGEVNEWLLMVTQNTVSLKELFPFGVAAYSILFVDKAIQASQWLSWIEFAFSTYLELHEDKAVNALREEIAALRAEVRELISENRKK